MCGEHGLAAIRSCCRRGSSPRVRGALHAYQNWDNLNGIIPACAGSTSLCRPDRASKRDHPRVCGEHPMPPRASRRPWGSSPRVRGAPHRLPGRAQLRRIIPACAGSTRVALSVANELWDHPRVCGEHSSSLRYRRASEGSSPRVRGAPFEVIDVKQGKGIIPACAGSTQAGAHKVCSRRDHPRVCGEHCGISPSAVNSWGSSPRVRGAL